MEDFSTSRRARSSVVFHNPKVERFFLQINGCSLIQEQGFDPTMSTYDYIWDLVQSHRWNNFCATLIEPVLIAPDVICQYYNAPYYAYDHLKLLDLFTLEDFDMEANYKVPLKFKTTIMFPMAKMWIQFICTHLELTHNVFDVIAYREVMFYEEMLKCIQSRKQSMYSTHLITTLYRQADIYISFGATNLTSDPLSINIYKSIIVLK
ncbi:hypothetical protein ES332_D10G209700v1 [Gossypium tomentosum]|uniref:Uncharacterized protein n=1 Tax=Gossypium tomentosum TaxID=34277 RepID=A0A5D2J7T0_GOSTO|nr:hypothetical protein ES332_D10G209700v1 [Gossypium tomentosum]